eukprot:scaffold1340_cov253-Pinguiococcus_pyrenoidosus.AAC.35
MRPGPPAAGVNRSVLARSGSMASVKVWSCLPPISSPRASRLYKFSGTWYVSQMRSSARTAERVSAHLDSWSAPTSARYLAIAGRNPKTSALDSAAAFIRPWPCRCDARCVRLSKHEMRRSMDLDGKPGRELCTIFLAWCMAHLSDQL